MVRKQEMAKLPQDMIFDVRTQRATFCGFIAWYYTVVSVRGIVLHKGVFSPGITRMLLLTTSQMKTSYRFVIRKHASVRSKIFQLNFLKPSKLQSSYLRLSMRSKSCCGILFANTTGVASVANCNPAFFKFSSIHLSTPWLKFSVK